MKEGLNVIGVWNDLTGLADRGKKLSEREQTLLRAMEIAIRRDMLILSVDELEQLIAELEDNNDGIT